MSEEAPNKEDNSNLLDEDKENEKEEKKKPNEDNKNYQGKDSLNDEEENKKSESDSESSKDLDSESNSEEKGKKDEDKGDEDNEENDDEEDIDDDDDIEDDEEEDKSGYSDDKKKKDPYRYYLISKVDYSINIKNLKNGDYLYGIKENKFYKVIDRNTKNSNNADNFTIILSLIDTSKAKTKKAKNEMKKIADNILYTALKYENKNWNKEANKDEKKNLDKKEEEAKGIKNQENSSENLKKIENKIEKGDEEKNKGKENEEVKESKNSKDNLIQEEKEEIKEDKKEKVEENENSEEKIKKNEEINNEDKKEEIVEKGDKEENTEKEKKKKEKEQRSDKNEKGEEKEKENKKDKKTNEEKNDKKSSKKSKSKKKLGLPITIKDYSNYTSLQKINIFYINYLNISHRLDMIIDINSSINDVILTFQKLYHFYCDKYSDEKPPLIVFINNKRYSPLSKTKNKYFIPTKFDYKNDFLVILEKETYKFEEYDMGRNRHYSSNKVNLKGAKVPHFVYSSYYNLQVESFIITKNIQYLECEVYELKKEFYFNIDPGNKRVSKKKIKDFLDLNWKEKSTLICVVKSGALRKSKDNYDGNCFEINKKFILLHGKIYIFVVTSSNKRVYTFNPRDFHNNGLIIVTRDDKGILNGFKAKRISDFIAY